MATGIDPSWPASVAITRLAAPRLATTPADGASLDAADAPSSLTFHLGGPAAVLWSDGGVELRRVSPDGTETTVVHANDWLATVAGSSDSATLNLPETLGAGRYRIVILGGSSLAYTYSQGAWDPMEDHAVAEFRVKAPEGATDLGVVGGDLLIATGSLDGPSAGASSFRIRLADGQDLWRLALQVDAGRIGSGLIAGLSVYDADGREVASAPIGSARSTGYPNDVYLFSALPPGEYQVVVSRPAAMPGGTFQLKMAADPVKGPTRVTSFALERSEAGVTGFSIAFSSAIDPARLRSDSLCVVDASGSVRAIRLASVGDGLTEARFEFLSPLPAGRYSLKVGGDAPIADLIGRTPVADALPAGTLAAWTVTPRDAASTPAPPTSMTASGSLDLAAGKAITIPIRLGPDESLVMVSRLTSGIMRVEVLGGPNGGYVASQGTGSPMSELWLHPGEGTFVIRITSADGSPLSGTWSLTRAALSDDSLVATAIGAREAIDLRLGEQAASPGGIPASTPRMRQSAVVTAGRNELGPSPWAYGQDSTPVGRPSSTADAVAPVGPATVDGVSSVAWAQGGGPGLGASLILSGAGHDDEAPPRHPSAPPVSAHEGQVIRAEAVAESDADDGALARAERVAEVVMSGFRWLLDRPSRATTMAAEVSDAIDGRALARAEASNPEADGSDGRVQRSALDLPFTVLLVTASTYHLRRATRRWWTARKSKADAAGSLPNAASPIGPEPLLRGPRLMLPKVDAARPTAPRRG